MKLAELQARFHALVTAPESVAATLAARGAQAVGDVHELVVGDARLSAVERLEIYANMYFFRIRDVLRDEFPRTAALLGDSTFHDLVVDYLAAIPPRHPSLREVGARLPAFLAAHSTARARPWLAELARLERTRLELVDAPDAETLTLDRAGDGACRAGGASPQARSRPCASREPLRHRAAVAGGFRARRAGIGTAASIR